ncbi:MAG: 50S ribosomal protein L18 [Candidatus Peregrinibacteria bacterium]
MLSKKVQQRYRRHNKIRARLSGTPERPRLCVYRSLGKIYAQLIDDTNGHVIAACSTLKMKKGKPLELAKTVGKELAAKAKAASITICVFDRGGYLYHGRVKAVAEGAREGGLKF